MRKTGRSQATPQYIALALLFIAASAYQIRALQERFPQWFGAHEPPAWPFLVTSDNNAPRFQIHFPTPDAVKAGLHAGDILLTINGQPVTGSAVFGREVSRSRIGDVIHVIASSGGKPFATDVTLTSANQQMLGSVSVMGACVISTFCLLLGFWVAVVRPRDRLAWLLLAFLLGFTTFFNPFPEAWGPFTRDLGAIYLSAFNGSFGLWLLLFALYFPDPIAPGSPGARFWKFFMWVVLVPTLVKTVLRMIISVGELERYPMVFWAVRVSTSLHSLFTVVSFAADIGFLVCLAWKWRLPATADARRRLRVVLLAAYCSYPLLLISNLVAVVRHSQMEEIFPPWFYNTAYLLVFVFPLSVAYVIVVQRAMDVRLIIRQSLQYTLARRGVIILQMVLGAVLFSVLATLVTAHAMSRTYTILLMAIGLWGIFLLNGLAHLLAKVIDRRFFREAYSAEQILGDLAQQVRTMVETEPLLTTVTQRISEALHVPRIAVLLDGSGSYRPACTLGYATGPAVAFTDRAVILEQLRSEKQPLRVYFDDPESWLYSADVSSEERENLTKLAPELLLPLLVQEDLIGFMALGQKRSEAPYSGSDLRLLNSVAAQTSLALEISRLTETVSREAAQREGLKRELDIAREVQQRLFPQELPFVPGLDYWAECRPAREVGGDYYDFVELPDDKLAIVIGDIAGKGIGAALMMANLQASLRGQVSSVRDLPELLKRVNKMVFQASSFNRYATFFFSSYDPRSGSLAYVNAGHNPPLVLRRSDKSTGWDIFRLDAGGPVIGLLPEVSYAEGSFALQPGDVLVLFTDGVSESMNHNEEEWGEERLIVSAQSAAVLDAKSALNRLMKEATDFAAGAPQHDDMTLVVVRVAASSRAETGS